MSDKQLHHPPKDNNLCQVVLAGNLVAKPEIRYKANPVIPVAEFVVATHQSWFDKSSNQFKNWTTFHPVVMDGEEINRQLIHAEKGQLIYLTGRLRTKKRNGSDVVHGEYYQIFDHGSNQGFNTIHCTGSVASEVKLVTTENNKQFAVFTIKIGQRHFAPAIEKWLESELFREVHVWGKAGINLAEKAQLGDKIMLEGSISYRQDSQKAQILEAKKVIL